MILNFGLCNVNSLVRKVPLVSDFLSTSNIHIFCITETHLLETMPSSFVAIPSYNIIRNDVQGLYAKHGVCMYIHEKIKFEKVDVSCPNVICVRLPELNIHVVGVYRSPSLTITENQILLDHLTQYCTEKEVLLLGDFNLPSLAWDQAEPFRQVTATDRLFLEAFVLLGLTQWVREPTYPRSGNVLDLILTSESDRIGAVDVLPPLPGCDHCPITCHYIFGFSTSFNQPFSHRKLWHKGNYKQISSCLAEIDWDFEFSYLDCQSAYSHFLDLLTPIVEAYVPVADELRVPRPPWKVRPPTSLINRRSTAW